MAFKELPDQVKCVPLEIEAAIGQITQHFKSSYKTVRFDFYKPEGFGEDKDSSGGRDDFKKKQRKLI